jgi:hypothetical protein
MDAANDMTFRVPECVRFAKIQASSITGTIYSYSPKTVTRTLRRGPGRSEAEARRHLSEDQVDATPERTRP